MPQERITLDSLTKMRPLHPKNEQERIDFDSLSRMGERRPITLDSITQMGVERATEDLTPEPAETTAAPQVEMRDPAEPAEPEERRALSFEEVTGERRRLPTTTFPTPGLPGGATQLPITGKGLSAYSNFMNEAGKLVSRGLRSTSLAITGSINKALEVAGLESLEVNPHRDMLYLWANRLSEAADEAFPDDPVNKGDFLSNQLPRAAANLLAQVAAAKTAGPIAAISLASTYSADEYTRALEATGDEDVAFNTFVKNLPVAGLTAFGAAQFVRRFDRFTGGSVREVLKKGFVGGIEEMSNEVAAAWGTNVIAKNAYDETRELTMGLKEGGAIGFILGFALNSVGLSMKMRTMDPNITPSERLQFDQAADFVLQQYDALPPNQKGPFVWGSRTVRDVAGPTEIRISKVTAGEYSGVYRGVPVRVTKQPEKGIGWFALIGDATDPGSAYTTKKQAERGAKVAIDGLLYGDSQLATFRSEVDPSNKYLPQGPQETGSFQEAMQHIHLQRRYGWDPEVTRRSEQVMIEAYRNLPEGQRGPVRPQQIVDQIESLQVDRLRSDDPAFGEFNQTNSDAILTDPATSKNAFHAWWKKYWAPSGLFPRRVFRRFMKSRAFKDTEIERVRILQRDLKVQLHKVYAPHKDGLTSTMRELEVSGSVLKEIDAVLKGEAAPETIHVRLRKPVREMRQHIDRLSRIMIKEGLIADKLVPGIKKNIGLYVHRRFRTHEDPTWKKKWRKALTQEQLNRAEHYIRSAYRKKLNREPTKAELDNALQNHAADADSRSGNPFIKRKDIAEPIAAIMGEIKDPFDNYALTVQKQVRHIANKRFINDITQRFEGVYFYRLGDQRTPEGHFAEIRAKDLGMETIGNLEGMRTTPEMKAGLQAAFSYDSTPAWAKYWMRVNAAPKYAKTVLNVTTHARNVLGGAEFLLRNAIIPSSPDFRTAYEVTTGAYFNKGGAWDAERLMLTELGLMRKSIRGRELEATFKDMDLSGDFVSNNLVHGVEQGNKMLKLGAKTSRAATELYQAQDDFLRILFFYAERNRLRRADPNISDEVVAQRIIDTYQNYDQLPLGIKYARRWPFTAPFASFPYEVIRTNFNTAKWARREIQSDNPEMRKIGYQRLAAQVASATAHVTAGAATRALLGMTSEEEDDRRRFFAPWDKRSTVAWVDADGPESRHINLSYTHPVQYITDPLLTLLGRGDEGTAKDQFVGAISKLFQPLLGQELLATSLRELDANRTATGSRVYNPADPFGDQMANIFKHFWDVFEPGTVSSGRRVHEALTDEFTDKEVPIEILALFGLRITKLNIEDGLSFKVRDYSQNRRDARSIYNRVKHDERATQRERDEAYRRANHANQEYFEELGKDIEAAYRLGTDWRQLETILTEAGLSKSQVQDLRMGRYTSFER